MKTPNSWLWCGIVALLTAAEPVAAQTPPSLGLRLFAGVNITGTVGSVYVVQSTSDLTQTNSWTSLAFLQLSATNFLFIDTNGPAQGNRFYRALLQSPPTNMVFIHPNTFEQGSPTNEVGHGADEAPRTIVTISHGFWMGRHEVTQREYLAVVGSNPSQFTGDLNRPVESVSWPEATNFCALLTAQQLAAGLITPGCQYRLPTEAEWEYAARAGTSTRFSYGEDPNATSLTNFAWYSANSGAMTHPVEQKAPNPWGVYDMEGNVLEWCLDWYGTYPGGFEIDPQGPASNPIGVKVIRGGAWDSFDTDCRSARRMSFGVSPFLKDFILGFRVVLACP
jgi:formylglycine-generating enzyme required for sulfatase activity